MKRVGAGVSPGGGSAPPPPSRKTGSLVSHYWPVRGGAGACAPGIGVAGEGGCVPERAAARGGCGARGGTRFPAAAELGTRAVSAPGGFRSSTLLGISFPPGGSRSAALPPLAAGPRARSEGRRGRVPGAGGVEGGLGDPVRRLPPRGGAGAVVVQLDCSVTGSTSKRTAIGGRELQDGGAQALNDGSYLGSANAGARQRDET